MKKTALLIIAFAMSALALSAQGHYQPRPLDGWQIQIGGGLHANWAYKQLQAVEYDGTPAVLPNGEPRWGEQAELVGRGYAPVANLRVEKFFHDSWGHHEWGVGIRYSGPFGKIKGEQFAQHYLAAEVLWRASETLWNFKLKHFELVPFLHAGCAHTDRKDYSLMLGYGGQIGWRFDSGLGIYGELRRTFGDPDAVLSAATIAEDANAPYEIIRDISASVGISWMF